MKTLFIACLVFVVSLAGTAQEQQQQQPKVVHFKKLQSFLPSKTIAGYTRTKPTGSTQKNMGFSSSEATVRYEKQTDSMTYSIEIKIVDMSLIPAGAWAMAYQQMEFENETEDGYEKTVTVGKSYRGIEKAQTGESKSCELNFAVGSRFHVQIDGSNIDDVKLLYALVDSMNLDTLAKLTAE